LFSPTFSKVGVEKSPNLTPRRMIVLRCPSTPLDIKIQNNFKKNLIFKPKKYFFEKNVKDCSLFNDLFKNKIIGHPLFKKSSYT